MKIVERVKNLWNAIPVSPEKYTQDELKTYSKAGKIAVLGTGVELLSIPIIFEGMINNSYRGVAGLALAATGVITAMNGAVLMGDIEKQGSNRIQAETLPLEYSEEN